MKAPTAELQAVEQIVLGNDKKNNSLKALLAQMYQSRSWKITRPIRWLNSFLHRSPSLDNEIITALDPQPVPPAPQAAIDFCLFENDLVIITGVPFDDVSGGQRGAQIARAALRAGRRVIYVYVYPKFDFKLKKYVDSRIEIPRLLHFHIDALTPLDLLQLVTTQATLLVQFPHPKTLPFLEFCQTRGMRTVFDLIDDWETSLGGDWFDSAVYDEIIRRAGVVIGTAHLLVQKLQEKGRQDALYLPNAANEYLFDKYKKYERPTDLPAGKKIGLYFGSLYGDWFAWDYLQAAAAHNPEITFALIGDNPGGKAMPGNVLFLGPRSIEQLPAYLACANFAILPFSPGKISDSVSPIKVFEYLFMEKPVVATRLPEIVAYPGVLIAEDPAHFASLCRQAGSLSPVGLVEGQAMTANEAFIAENSWFARLDVLLRAQEHPWQHSVSAVILIHNNRPIIGRCLGTLLLHNASFLKEVIVVDNASADDGAAFVRQNYPAVQVISNPVNGCSSGRNLGAAAASGKYLAFFDSDQWFTSASAFLEALTILDAHPSIGAVGWGAGWLDVPEASWPVVDSCVNRAMNDAALRYGFRRDIGYLATSGLFMPKTVFDATGGFDTNFDPTTFEDTDLALQIKKLGFELAYRDLCGLRHQPHQTTQASADSQAYVTLFKKNLAYFHEKWKDYPRFFVRYQA